MMYSLCLAKTFTYYLQGTYFLRIFLLLCHYVRASFTLFEEFHEIFQSYQTEVKQIYVKKSANLVSRINKRHKGRYEIR